jgi:geranylgeranyl diphosphate synthase type I
MFEDELASKKKAVDAELEKTFKGLSAGATPLAKANYDFMREFVTRGGKRLRPAALITAFEGLGGRGNVARASLSVELLHNATLLHDDLMDRDATRRGKPTCHVFFADYFRKKHGDDGAERFGECMAIIGGNLLYNMGQKALFDAGFDAEKTAKAVSAYSRVFDLVNLGQMEDIEFEKRADISEADYTRMVTNKTSVLFGASVEIGALLAGARDAQVKALVDFALPTAQAFQMQDDVIGVFGRPEETGKSTQGDIENGKRTLLLIKAWEFATPVQKKRIDGLFGRGALTAKQADEARKLLVETGSLEYSQEKARELAEKGKKSLGKAGLSPGAERFFLGFADFVISRAV